MKTKFVPYEKKIKAESINIAIDRLSKKEVTLTISVIWKKFGEKIVGNYTVAPQGIIKIKSDRRFKIIGKAIIE